MSETRNIDSGLLQDMEPRLTLDVVGPRDGGLGRLLPMLVRRPVTEDRLLGASIGSDDLCPLMTGRCVAPSWRWEMVFPGVQGAFLGWRRDRELIGENFQSLNINGLETKHFLF